MMRKTMATLFALALVVGLSTSSLAQTTEPAPAAAAATAAAATAAAATSAYVTVDLQAGFALDPFLVSVNGGGEIAASTLDAACTGFVTENPVVVVRWDAEVEGSTPLTEAEIFFYSDGDPTLAVQLPDGTFVCNDDAHDNLLDPLVLIPTPASGEYKIWVGSYDENQLIPGLLVVSGNLDINLGNFDPGALVKREQIIHTDVAPIAAPEATEAQALISSTTVITPDGVIAADGETLTATVTSAGSVPAILFNRGDSVCSGLLERDPSFILQVEADLSDLRIFFEGDADASLVVLSDQLDVACNDEAVNSENANPQIDIPGAKAGYYAVWVGRFDPETAVTGTLTLHADDVAAPAILEPVATPESD